MSGSTPTPTEAVLRLAIRSYPRDYRQDHGDELVGTALELGVGRVRVREVAGLVNAGLRTRSDSATKGDRWAIWMSGVRIALYLSIASIVAEMIVVLRLGPRADLSQDQLSIMVVSSAVLLGVVGLSFLLRRARLTASVATVAGVVSWFWGPPMPRIDLLVMVVAYLAMIWLIALAAPARPLVAQMVAWSLVVSAVALMIDNFFIAEDLVVVALTVFALVAATVDPRLLAGMTVFWLVENLVALPQIVQLNGYSPVALLAINTLVVVVCAAAVLFATRPRPV